MFAFSYMTGGNTLCLVWVFLCNLLCFGFEITVSVFKAPMNCHLYLLEVILFCTPCARRITSGY